jgi:lysophospholipase
MFHQADIDALQAALPPCRFHHSSATLTALVPYLQFYGLPRPSPTLHCSAGVLESGGFRLFCQYHAAREQASRGTVFVIHGYYDHAGLYSRLLRHLLGLDFGVVLFDLPGHGLSSGARASIDSFSQYTDVLESVLQQAAGDALPQPWHLLGQSTGASIAMDYTLRHCQQGSGNVEKVVLLAPLVRPHQWWRGRALHAVLKHLVAGIPRSFVDNSHDEAFLHFVRELDPLQSRQLSARWVSALKRWLPQFESAPPCDTPLEVIQGTGDTTVDWQYNLQAIARRFPRAHIAKIAGARHHLVNEGAPYQQQVFAMLDKVFQ